MSNGYNEPTEFEVKASRERLMCIMTKLIVSNRPMVYDLDYRLKLLSDQEISLSTGSRLLITQNRSA